MSVSVFQSDKSNNIFKGKDMMKFDVVKYHRYIPYAYHMSTNADT